MGTSGATAPGITLLGIPFDGNSSFLRGAAAAPPLVRRALYSDSSNLWTESGVDLGAGSMVQDAGDLQLPEDCAAAFSAIEQAVGQQLARDARLLVLGGDHSITFPVVRAVAPRFASLTLLHFDAHPDLYDHFEGNRYSHACPFARIMEAGLVKRLVQVGIRTINRQQREQAERFGVEVLEMHRELSLRGLELQAPLYVSFDMDVLDPAFAPGVSHWEPGGLSVREAIGLIQEIEAPLVAADIVEYNPERDPSGRTAMVAAKVLKELAAKLLA
jgi:agmatinase